MSLPDRQLLMIAAEALDLPYDPTVKSDLGLFVASKENQGLQYLWNPLNDHEQALELLLLLKLSPVIGTYTVVVVLGDEVIQETTEHQTLADAWARVVVRAAIYLGGRALL